MIKKIIVPAHKTAQEILSYYKKKAINKPELIRIKLAEELCLTWKNKKIELPLPAIPDNKDYWYLVQLYFMDRHIHKDNKPYLFNWHLSEEIYLEDTHVFLTKLLLAECQKKVVLPITRELIDFLILNFQERILEKLGFNNKLYKICHIPFDIYIRITKDIKQEDQNNNFFDGYRLRTDGKLMSLFGRENFIDSLWCDFPNKNILPRLIIIRKDYGY